MFAPKMLTEVINFPSPISVVNSLELKFNVIGKTFIVY